MYNVFGIIVEDKPSELSLTSISVFGGLIIPVDWVKLIFFFSVKVSLLYFYSDGHREDDIAIMPTEEVALEEGECMNLASKRL